MRKNYLKIPVYLIILSLMGITFSSNHSNNLLKNFKTNFVNIFKKKPHEDIYKNSAKDNARKVKYLNDLEKNVILELNKVRTNPAQYAKTQLTELKSYYQENIINYPDGNNISTHEGLKAVDECINVLLNTKPLGILFPSEGLSKAAKDHVKDQSITINTGHYGSDKSSPFDRMNRYGKWLFLAGENIDYGYDQADLIVLSLLVDDGVPDRGHRTNILKKDFNVIGVASGEHKLYRKMFVMDFAGGYKEND